MLKLNFKNPKITETVIYSYDIKTVGSTPSGLVPSVVIDCNIRFTCDIFGIQRETRTSLSISDVEFEIFEMLVNPYDCDFETVLTPETLDFYYDLMEVGEEGVHYGQKIRILKELADGDFDIKNIENAIKHLDLSRMVFYPSFKNKNGERYLKCCFSPVMGICFECSVKTTNPIVMEKLSSIEQENNFKYNVYYNQDDWLGEYEWDDYDYAERILNRFLEDKIDHGKYDEIVFEDCFILKEYWTIIDNNGREDITGYNRMCYVADPRDF